MVVGRGAFWQLAPLRNLACCACSPALTAKNGLCTSADTAVRHAIAGSGSRLHFGHLTMPRRYRRDDHVVLVGCAVHRPAVADRLGVRADFPLQDVKTRCRSEPGSWRPWSFRFFSQDEGKRPVDSLSFDYPR